MIGRLALTAALFATVAAPLTAADKKPAPPPPPPPRTEGYTPQGELERGLWFEMDEQERLLKQSKFVVDDPALNAYVKGVLCREVGAGRCKATRVYIVRTPYFNASMAPNGTMIVYTGLFLRVRNEAQLAAVLGHEFTHFEERHTLALFKDIKAKTDAMSWLSFIPIPYVGMLAQVAMMSGVYSFSRDMERRADSGSIRELVRGGYDPREASRIWEQLGAELDATAKERGHKSEKNRGGLFATHPKTTERMTALATQAQATAQADPGVTRADEYHAALRAWWPRLIDDQVKLQDFGGTEYLLNTLAQGQSGWSADLLYARAELYRARAKTGDYAAAAGFYNQAIAAGNALPEVWRGLGIALLHDGRQAEGKAALQTYLRLKPDATDASLIGQMASPTA